MFLRSFDIVLYGSNEMKEGKEFSDKNEANTAFFAELGLGNDELAFAEYGGLPGGLDMSNVSSSSAHAPVRSTVSGPPSCVSAGPGSVPLTAQALEVHAKLTTGGPIASAVDSSHNLGGGEPSDIMIEPSDSASNIGIGMIMGKQVQQGQGRILHDMQTSVSMSRLSAVSSALPPSQLQVVQSVAGTWFFYGSVIRCTILQSVIRTRTLPRHL